MNLIQLLIDTQVLQGIVTPVVLSYIDQRHVAAARPDRVELVRTGLSAPVPKHAVTVVIRERPSPCRARLPRNPSTSAPAAP